MNVDTRLHRDRHGASRPPRPSVLSAFLLAALSASLLLAGCSGDTPSAEVRRFLRQTMDGDHAEARGRLCGDDRDALSRSDYRDLMFSAPPALLDATRETTFKIGDEDERWDHTRVEVSFEGPDLRLAIDSAETAVLEVFLWTAYMDEDDLERALEEAAPAAMGGGQVETIETMVVEAVGESWCINLGLEQTLEARGAGSRLDDRLEGARRRRHGGELDDAIESYRMAEELAEEHQWLAGRLSGIRREIDDTVAERRREARTAGFLSWRSSQSRPNGLLQATVMEDDSESDGDRLGMWRSIAGEHTTAEEVDRLLVPDSPVPVSVPVP